MTQRHVTRTADAYRRVGVRIRRVTAATVLTATGATAIIGVVVAREHAGSASSGAHRSSVGTARPSTNGHSPAPTRSAPVVTSGGTSR